MVVAAIKVALTKQFSPDPLLSTTCSALNKMHWSPQTLCSPQLAVCSTKCTSLSALHPMLCSSPKHPTVSSAQPLHCLSKDPSVQCISPIHCECKELCPHIAHTVQSAHVHKSNTLRMQRIVPPHCTHSSECTCT